MSCYSAQACHSPVTESPPRFVSRRKRSSICDPIKILILGAPQVGRSALTLRFLTRRFIGDYDSSSEHRYRQSFVVDLEHVLVEVVDERSTRPIGIIREELIKWAEAFVLVYSITDLASYNLARLFRRRIVEGRRAMASLPVLLVGAKSDLEHFRAVPKDDGELMAAEYGALFAELSAADQIEPIRQAFVDLCREVVICRRRSKTLLNRVFGLARHKNSY